MSAAVSFPFCRWSNQHQRYRQQQHQQQQQQQHQQQQQQGLESQEHQTHSDPDIQRTESAESLAEADPAGSGSEYSAINQGGQNQGAQLRPRDKIRKPDRLGILERILRVVKNK